MGDAVNRVLGLGDEGGFSFPLGELVGASTGVLVGGGVDGVSFPLGEAPGVVPTGALVGGTDWGDASSHIFSNFTATF